ncbi:MAG: MFS transporter [Mycobacteriaceae bacterium]|nr:MFS transporter [Mycobacteriaceae bacterium]
MTSALKVPPQEDTRFFGHPIGLATLFGTELWERFSYYGMLAILVLYLAADESEGGLGLSATTAIGIFGVYSAMVYLLSVPGGWIADRILGPYRTVLIGACTIAVGHYVLAVPSPMSVWPGMVLVALGTGLLKPNISAMVGSLYDQDPDEGERRDAGFSLFYMGINIGAFAAPLICGLLAEKIGWHVGFGAAGIGMTAAVIIYLAAGRRTLGSVGRAVPNPETPAQLRRLALIGTAFLAVSAVVFIADYAAGRYRAEHLIWFLAAVTVATPIAYFFRSRRAPTLPNKFVLALLLIGISFLVMAVLANIATGGTKVLWIWLVTVVVVQTVGELLLSPTGLAASSHLAPKRIESQVLALWFLSSAVGDAIGSTTAPLQDSLGQVGYFVLIGGAAVILAGVIATQARRIHTLMGGIH